MVESGVLFNPPPIGPIMQAVSQIALDAAANLPAGSNGGVFAIATTVGVNAVIVNKVNNHFTVTGWVGKKWGQPLEAGAAAVFTW